MDDGACKGLLVIRSCIKVTKINVVIVPLLYTLPKIFTFTRWPYDVGQMPAKVILSLEKIANPNCGLGRISLDFSRALVNLDDRDTELAFLLYKASPPPFLKDQPIKRIAFLNRYFPLSLQGFDLFHSLHQLSSFRVKGAGKSVLTLHDLNFLHVKSKARARRYLKKVQRNVDRSDALVFVSHFTREESHRYLNIPAGKITTVIYNGVELPKTDPVKPEFLKADLYLFSIGQFLAKKNFHVLIPFLKKLPDEIKLVIAGENNTAYGDFVKKTVAEHNLQKRVLLPGPVTEAEKLFLYKHCTAFVFPSLAEGFGLPVLEAMRAGKPVFCSDRTSLKEIGSRHVNFWESFDTGAMSKVYFSGMTGFNELKKNAAYDYSLKFSWQENAREYLLLYKTLLSRL